MKGIFRPRNPEKYEGNPTNIIYRSSWELKMMTWLDTHSSVRVWQSEELAIPYRSPIDNLIHRYFPDMVVTMTNGQKYICEIKPKKQCSPPKPKKNKKRMLQEAMEYAKNNAKWNAAKAYAESKGWQFKIMTEENLYGK